MKAKTKTKTIIVERGVDYYHDTWGGIDIDEVEIKHKGGKIVDQVCYEGFLQVFKVPLKPGQTKTLQLTIEVLE